MYNLDRTQFVKVAKDLTENELLPIYFHQKAVCNLFGLEFHTHQSKNPREKFLQTIFNSYDRVKQQLDDLEIDNESFKPIEAIINSMTPKERALPSILDQSRKRRISRGSC